MTTPDPLKRMSPFLIWLATALALAILAPFLFVICGWQTTVVFGLLMLSLGYTGTLLVKHRADSALVDSMRDSKHLLRTVTSSLPLFLYRCRNDTDWTTLFKTEGCLLVTGYKVSDFVSGNIRFGALIHEAHRDAIWKKWQDALKAKVPVELDYPIQHADGSERWLWERGHGVYSDDGTLLYIEGLVVDITDRKHAEQERDRLLAESNETRRVLLSVLEDERRSQTERARLVSAIEQAGESIVITDTEGIIQYVNPAFTKASGYTAEEALGQHTRILKSGKQPDALYRDLWETVSRGEVWSGRLENRHKDGTIYTEDATISAVTDSKGQIINYVAVKRDITHEIQLEQQLLHSQKMEVIGQMAGGIAHDFNNNLQTVMGFTDLAIEDHDDEDRLKEYLSEVRKAGESASALTRQLLAFSRRQVLARQAVDMNELLTNMTNMIRRAIGENVAFDWNPHPGAGEVNGDPGQLEQVIFNLVLNARDAMPEGGRLTITLSTTEFYEEDLLHHPEARTGRHVCIAITDTGTGIPQDLRTKIFEPFFTTKPSSKGTGLGLSTVYGIVKQHDGWITVYSEENKGTEFHLYLPVAEAMAQADISQSARQNMDISGKGERLLVVEDEDGIRELMRKMLTSAGYHVTCAASAEEGQEVYERNHGCFHMIVSDVVLPNQSGFDLVEALKQKHPNLKVLMVSGYTDERTRWPQIRQKGWRYLQKPVNRKVLLTTLREILTNT